MTSHSPTRSAPSPTDLFDQRHDDWTRDPRRAFDAWLVKQAFRRSSAEVYQAQWNHFIDWLELRGRSMANIDAGLVGEFLDSLATRKQQRTRYLRLIERVYDHLAKHVAELPNPARGAALKPAPDTHWQLASENEPTGFLNADERAALAARMHAPLPRSPGARWRALRDRALVGVFLGAGLKTGEAQALPEHSLARADGWLEIGNADPRLTRRICPAPFARAAFEAWLAVRAEMRTRGALAFPSGIDGRPMHKATVLRAIDAEVEAAGITASRTQRASPQTMRNAFAASLFESGTPPEQVAQWLGMEQLESAVRLQMQWQAWRRNETDA
ncbi:tyrosine-type recombinase/integrase [Pararobbsia silviterrae]|uniref:Site-specific integrase n=1 Tax=Pararobbsia silviterrae TaxID=1792498 RepID=A0A494XDI5_9BURK|nr:tyrosine-type recombinase/integrase [Pararobbsia silviterrae]RKP46219.1 site-specific integrase [Pararobbsia silviterrae]